MARERTLDFTNVKERGEYNPKHQPPGDYRAVITAVKDTKTSTGKQQWSFTIRVGSGTYPYRCQFEANVLWKIRNLAVSAGLTPPKKKATVNPDRLVGKEVAVTLIDHDYDGKTTSEIDSVFPLSELAAAEGHPSESDDDDEEEEATGFAAGDDDDDEEEEPAPVAKKAKKAAPVEEEEEDEEEAPPVKVKKDKKKKAKKTSDLEELDIEDL